MNINESIIENVHLVELDGRLDTVTAPDFQQKLLATVADGSGKYLVDCTKLSYISSSGLRVFLMGLKKVKASGGKFVLCALQESIAEIFEIAGFSKLFTIATNKDEALAQLN